MVTVLLVVAGLAGAADGLPTQGQVDRLIEAIRKAETMQAYTEAEKSRQEETDRIFSQIARDQVPPIALVSFPETEKWSDISRKAAERRAGCAAAPEPEWKKEMRESLKRPIPVVDYSETPIGDVADLLHDMTGLNIVLDEEVAKNPDMTVTLRLQGTTIEDTLNWICRLHGLKYVLRDHAVFLTLKSKRVEEGVLVVYDLSDVLVPLDSFAASVTSFSLNGEQQAERQGGLLGEEGVGSNTSERTEELIRFLRALLPPGVWADAGEGTGLPKRAGLWQRGGTYLFVWE